MSIFSSNLRFLRKKANHNQDDIALLFNKRANTIGNWENQKSEPSLSELLKLGEFFKVSTEDLLNRDLQSQPSASVAPAVLRIQEVKADLGSDKSPLMTGEVGADAFWLILRELRTLQAKVDLLMAEVGSAGLKRISDKSDH